MGKTGEQCKMYTRAAINLAQAGDKASLTPWTSRLAGGVFWVSALLLITYVTSTEANTEAGQATGIAGMTAADATIHTGTLRPIADK